MLRRKVIYISDALSLKPKAVLFSMGGVFFLHFPVVFLAFCHGSPLYAFDVTTTTTETPPPTAAPLILTPSKTYSL